MKIINLGAEIKGKFCMDVITDCNRSVTFQMSEELKSFVMPFYYIDFYDKISLLDTKHHYEKKD